MISRETPSTTEEPVSLGRYRELRTPIPRKMRLFNPKRYSDYIDAHPEASSQIAQVLEMNEDFGLYSLTYSSGLLSEDHFMEAASAGEANLEELLVYQMKRRYLSTKLVIRNRKEPYPGKSRGEVFEPELRFTYILDEPDPYINMLMALKLAQGKVVSDGKTVDSAVQLDAASKTVFKRLNKYRLLLGFDSLLQRERIEELLGSGAVKETDLPALYEHAANYMADLALQISARNKFESITLPYPLASYEEALYPEVSFLPFATLATLRYMVELPEYIKENQQVALLFLSSTVRRLQAFNQAVMTQYLKDGLGVEGDMSVSELYNKACQEQPDLADDIKSINGALNFMAVDFQTLLLHYQAHPFLINRMTPEEGGSEAILTYPQWRQELLEHGARAPIKPTKFRFRYKVPVE